MFYNKKYNYDNAIPNDDIDFINEYVSVLRENGILSELIILDEKYFYSIFVIDGANIIDNEKILQSTYEIDNKYREIKSKNIHTNYSSGYLSKKEIFKDKINDDMVDITFLFNQI